MLDWLFILFCILDFREGFDDVAEDLLKKLIALDQSERISVEEAIDHPFFDSIRDFEEKQKEYKQNQMMSNSAAADNNNNCNLNHIANNNNTKGLQGINSFGIPAGAHILH